MTEHPALSVAQLPITVVLVDDHQLIREGLRRAFDRAGDIDVVGEAGSVTEALGALERLRPDVLVTDVRLPDGDGISLTRHPRAAASAVVSSSRTRSDS